MIRTSGFECCKGNPRAGLLLLHWQCGKNRPAASALVAASSGRSRDECSQVFHYSFLQKR